VKPLDEVKSVIEIKLRPEMAQKAKDEARKPIPVTISDDYFGK
jgi:hypothetical protein